MAIKGFVLSLILVAGCSTVQLPPTPPKTKPLITFSRFEKVKIGERVVPILYDTNLNLSAYCWQAQYTTDLVNWIDIPSPCLTNDIYTGTSNAMTFFRVMGVPK